MTNIQCFMADLNGIASVRELAEHLDVSEREVREWAHENEIPRAGNAFAFRVEDAEALVLDLETADDDDDPAPGDEDSDDEDEDDEDGGDPDEE